MSDPPVTPAPDAPARRVRGRRWRWPRALGACGLACVVLAAVAAGRARAEPAPRVPILVYHRFGPVAADSMTVTTRTFEQQLCYLAEHGYHVIPLRQFVEFRLGRAPAPAPRSVILTADDAHRSVYTDMLPLVRRYGVPVTLFVYPSAVSRARYALSWEELRALRETGLFDLQSHTYWHPNFNVERRRRTPADFERFVMAQLTTSRDTMRRALGTTPDLLAWPFGIFDQELVGLARQAGYVAGLTLERRPAGVDDDLMALPRYLMTEAQRGSFAGVLAGGEGEAAR